MTLVAVQFHMLRWPISDISITLKEKSLRRKHTFKTIPRYFPEISASTLKFNAVAYKWCIFISLTKSKKKTIIVTDELILIKKCVMEKMEGPLNPQEKAVYLLPLVIYYSSIWMSHKGDHSPYILYFFAILILCCIIQWYLPTNVRLN